MKKEKKTFGLRLYSMFIGSILILVMTVTVCFWIYSNRTMIEREKRNSQNVLDSVSQNMELQFADITNIEKSLYIYNEMFQELEIMNNRSLYETYDELAQIELEENYTMTLTKLIHTSTQDIRAVVFFPMSGDETAFYLGKDNSKLREISYPDYHSEPWFAEAVERQDNKLFYKPHIPEYMPNKKLGEVYSYIKAVKSVDSKKVIGVLKVDIGNKMLQESLDVLENSRENGLVVLQNDEFFSGSEWLEEGIKFTDMDKAKAGDVIYETQTVSIPNTDLTLVYLTARSSLYRGYLYLFLLSVLILAVGGGLSFVNYRRQASRLVGDVRQITDILGHVEKGDLDVQIKVSEDSEFRTIADAINRMTENLKKYIEKEYLLEIQQQKAEYRALQSQINPHFLYNTLNGFVALNRMGEQKVLERSILELSRLFRYACSGREVVMVQEEMKFLDDYLKLEKLKYEERLEYIIWTDEASRQKKIPKLLLQPLVENSIKHGMGDTDRPVMIQILARTKKAKGIGSVTVLTVRDNGAGFDSRDTEKNREHVGVDNVRARAELYCRDALFQCVSVPGKGTKTTVVFPDNGQEEDK